MLFLVRHAESRWNAASAEERRRGQFRDADLSARGEAQLAVLAARIASGGLARLDAVRVIFTSPLTRAIRTALAIQSALAKRTGAWAPVVAVACLREVRRDAGDEGSAAAGLVRRFRQVRGLRRLRGSWWRVGACGCPRDAECAECVARRVWAVKKLATGSAGPALLVSHSDLLREVCGWDAPNAGVATVG